MTDVAHEWAVKAGYAKELSDGDLQRQDNIDTIGETVVTIGNSERSVEDFALVHKIIANANRGAETVAHSVLADMVEAADFMFAPIEDLPHSPEPATT